MHFRAGHWLAVILGECDFRRTPPRHAMELRQLQYFLAIADAGTFINAAHLLNVAQPALTRQIQALERELGVALFARRPHGVALTPAGMSFAADARRIVAATKDAARRAKSKTARAVPSLHVGYGEMLGHWGAFCEMLHQFRVVNAGVRIVAEPIRGTEVRAAILEERTDVAVIAASKLPVKGLEGMPLVDATLTGVLIPGDHKLAKQRTVRLADLHTMTWLHLATDSTLGVFPVLNAALRERGCIARRRLSRPTGFSYLPLISAGDAWALADEATAHMVTDASNAVVYRPFAEEPIPVWAVALWKQGQRRDCVLDFVRTARNAAAQLASASVASASVASAPSLSTLVGV